MILCQVSELESSEGVPGLGGGDQAGFALWLTLLQVLSSWCHGDYKGKKIMVIIGLNFI